MPAIAKILIVFFLMLAATRVRLQLGLALLLGGLGLNLWAGCSPVVCLMNLVGVLKAVDLWLLMAITALIIEVGRFMTEGRNAQEILAATRRWGGRHGRAVALVAVPAVIGLVPMPAGALFSAPFVEKSGAGDDRSAAWKSAVNYWFRHVWEYWWPLYPGVIVAMAIFDMGAAPFVAVQFPFTLVAIGAGYGFLIRPHVRDLAQTSDVGEGSDGRAVFILLPLATVVISLLMFPLLFSLWVPGAGVQVHKLLALLMGLVLALGIVFVDERRCGAARNMFSTLVRPTSRSVLFSLAGVLAFKSLLTDSGLLPMAADELVAARIPIGVAVAVLPFLAGLVTGVAVGFAGTSLPLVVGLVNASGYTMTAPAALVLAYGFGYMGMMVSPVHLCLLVTKDYFSATLPAVLRSILPCVATILIYTLALHSVLRLLG
jgi:integral membrane protein (TIGR00529 family)